MKLCIVDVGARYGLHPSFKEFEEIAKIHLFDLDYEECKKLNKKYSNKKNIRVHNIGLSDSIKEQEVFYTKHKGLTSTYQIEKSYTEKLDYMKEESKIVNSTSQKFQTLDSVINDKIDFLKLDVEGSEFDILNGSEYQLKNNILAIRAEVSFNNVFKGQPLFGQIDNFLRKFNFELLNLDYNGKGHGISKYTLENNYGYLVTTDAVWVKNIESVHDNYENVLKLIVFLMLNKATDIAMNYLIKYHNDFNKESLCTDKLWLKLMFLVERLFKDISYLPYIEQKELEHLFKSIFLKEMKVMHEYFESLM